MIDGLTPQEEKNPKKRAQMTHCLPGTKRKRVCAYLDEEEYAKLVELAEMRNSSLSGTLIEYALYDRRTRTKEGALRLIAIVDELRPYRRQLLGIATNLNQAAYYANSEKMLPPNFAELVEQIRKIAFLIDDALNEIE